MYTYITYTYIYIYIYLHLKNEPHFLQIYSNSLGMSEVNFDWSSMGNGSPPRFPNIFTIVFLYRGVMFMGHRSKLPATVLIEHSPKVKRYLTWLLAGITAKVCERMVGFGTGASH